VSFWVIGQNVVLIYGISAGQHYRLIQTN
jgi:hypothetical protein